MLTISSVVPAIAEPAGATVHSARLTIDMYNLAALSESLLQASAQEADRLLQGLDVAFVWLDCLSPTDPCSSELDRPEFLAVRLVPHALAPASKNALGMTTTAANGSCAAVFCDRGFALRTRQILLARILGSVMAHEIIHMLLPTQPHAPYGLMREEWSAQDLRIGSQASSGVSKGLADLVHAEAVRRHSCGQRAPEKRASD